MCGSGAGTGQAPVGGWQLRGGQRGQGEPHSPRAISGSSTSEPNRAPVLWNWKQQNPVEEPVHEQDQVSTTDPDSTYATKGGTPARLGYYDNYLIDNHSCVIVGCKRRQHG